MEEITFKTKEKNEIIDITSSVERKLEESNIKEGICVVYVVHATAGIIINENWDDSVQEDLLQMLKELAPEGRWKHDKIDGNGASHVKAGLIGPSETIIVSQGKLVLGQWQNIFLCEFDGPRTERKVLVKIIGK